MILTFLAHEVSKLCHYFMVHGGLITGAVEDAKPRRSQIPSGGQEIKLRLTFRAVAPLADKMKVLLRQQYDFEFDGQQQGDINNENGGGTLAIMRMRIRSDEDLTYYCLDLFSFK